MKTNNNLLEALEAAIRECRRLEERVEYLENLLDLRNNKPQKTEFKPVHNNNRNRNQRRKQVEKKPEVEIKSVHRRTTNDLYREAREKYEEQLKAQEAMVDEMAERAERKPGKSAQVLISEGKKQYLVESAKAIMNGSKR